MQTLFLGSHLQLKQKKESYRQIGHYWVITTVHLSLKSCKPTVILKFHSSWIEAVPKASQTRAEKAFCFFKYLNEKRVWSHARYLWTRISPAIKLLAAFNMCKRWPMASLVLGLSVQNWISTPEVTSATHKLSCFWLEPKVFICVIFFLGEVLVYFDFEACFHSPNTADGLLMRNHLRGFGNRNGEKVGGGSQSNVWPKWKK